ncbi:hypothetical protein F5Y04DRAFT_281673 [Hypomontagnella monticulosa]|nr:hypothetical protein F5Y04DRAFT_281673 [Hypomontagnella monticulosa]
MDGINVFILLGISLLVYALRLYARVTAVGWRGLCADDYLMLIVALAYSAQAACTYAELVTANGLANDGMTPDERMLLSPDSEEYAMRVLGSKLEVVTRVQYITVLWLTKAAMLAFCQRLTSRLGEYRTRIRVGFAMLAVTWVSDILVTMLSCRPLYMNWQINPDPGVECHPATTPYTLFGTLSFNILTSLYVFFVPLPILWMAHIKLWKKIGLILLILANCFVVAISILRGYLITTAGSAGARLANRWAYRVCFVAVVAANLPLLFPMARRMMKPFIKERRKPQRGIRTITIWERAGLTSPRSQSDSSESSGDTENRDNRKFKYLICFPCCSAECSNETELEDATTMADTGFSMNGADLESCVTPPGRVHREMMVYSRDHI